MTVIPLPGLVPGAVAVAAITATSPWWRRRHPWAVDAVAPALAPWAALAGVPLAAVAALGRQRAIAAAALALGGAGVTMRRWVRGVAEPHPSAGGGADDTVRIGHFNLWYANARPDAAARTLAALDVDVLVLSEITPSLAQRFAAAGVTADLPHRLERLRPRAAGMAIWSRHPLRELAHGRLRHARIRATVAHPSGRLIVDAVHVQSPIVHPMIWARDLGVLAAEDTPVEPAVLVGDFNAAWTHHHFRRIVQGGWRDAHRALGVGTRNSWRTDYRFVPAFVRLDHALVNTGFDVVAVDDIDLPGSDHRGFVVTLRRRAA